MKRMKQSLCWLLTLAMLFSVMAGLVVGVAAEVGETSDPTLIASGSCGDSSNNTLIIKSGNQKLVKVFAINGAEVEAEIKSANDMTSVGLNQLPEGAYIIRVGNTSFKVLKK